MLRRFAKWIAELLFAPYELNRIYLLDVTQYDKAAPSGFDLRPITSPDQIRDSPDPQMREHAWYAGEEAHAFGLWENGALVCMCVFWSHRRFRDAGILKLQERQVVMVDLITVAECRGRGYAPIVIRYAETELKRAGFQTLYSWVWHSNQPSIRAFEKAGWSYIAFVAKLTPIGYGKAIRLERRVRPRVPRLS